MCTQGFCLFLIFVFIFCLLFFKSCVVLVLTLRPTLCFEFCYMLVSVYPSTICWNNCAFPHWISLILLARINLPWTWSFISQFWFCHWSILSDASTTLSISVQFWNQYEISNFFLHKDIIMDCYICIFLLNGLDTPIWKQDLVEWIKHTQCYSMTVISNHLRFNP